MYPNWIGWKHFREIWAFSCLLLNCSSSFGWTHSVMFYRIQVAPFEWRGLGKKAWAPSPWFLQTPLPLWDIPPLKMMSVGCRVVIPGPQWVALLLFCPFLFVVNSCFISFFLHFFQMLAHFCSFFFTLGFFSHFPNLKIKRFGMECSILIFSALWFLWGWGGEGWISAKKLLFIFSGL